MSNTLPVRDWLKFVDEEYLSTFIKDGGASVKFAVAPDDLKPDLYKAVKERCRKLNYVFADLNADNMRAYMPQDIFFGLASHIDWRLLARRLVLSLASENGYVTNGAELGHSGNLIEAIAAANDLDPAFVRLSMNRAIQDSVYRNQNLVRDFRVCMTQLCLMNGDIGTQGDYSDQPLIDWLTGANTRIGNVRPFAIRTTINRTTARYFIESALYWVRHVGYSGTVILLDNSRVTLTRRPKPPDGKRYYTKAMTMEHYELMREFIDDVDRLSGTLLVVVTNYEFTDEQSARGWSIYSALRTRVMDDVRDLNLVNPAASLVRLSEDESEEGDVPW